MVDMLRPSNALSFADSQVMVVDELADTSAPVVLVRNGTSLAEITNGAEEASFFLAGRKDLKDRKLDDGIARLGKIQDLLEEYLQKVPDLEHKQKLDTLLGHLQSGQLKNMEQLQSYLQGFSSEVCHQFVALSYARQALAQKTDGKALLALIDQALLQMVNEQGQAIELGVRIGPMAQEAQEQGVGEIQQLRDTYRDAVMDYQGFASAWSDINARFGGPNLNSSALEGVAGFMMKALSADLEQQQGKTDTTKLERVMSDMSKLRILSGLYDQVTSLWQVVVEGVRGHGVRPF